MGDSRDSKDRSSGANTGDVRHPTGTPAVENPVNAAQQDQVKADHDALQESARRVEASVPASVRETPIQSGRQDASADPADVRHANPENAAVDPAAASRQDQVKADHDALQESARRVESSVPPEVRDSPIRHTEDAARPSADATQAKRDSEAAHENAEAARESDRRNS